MNWGTGFDDAFDAIFIAQEGPPRHHCEHAPQCKGARIVPQGSTDPMACEAVDWCGLRRQIASGEAEPKTPEEPELKAAPPADRYAPPRGLPADDWDKLKAQARAEQRRKTVARMASAGHRSRYAVQWGGSLADWERNRPTYASVADAVRELCDHAPKQWERAITRMAALPRKLRDIQRWDGATEAMERLAAFDERHGDALAWVLTDDEIRQRAHDLAVRVELGVGRIFRAHRVSESAAAQAEQRLQRAAEFERATQGKTALQVRKATGHDLTLWARQAAMTDTEKTEAAGLLERMRHALREAVDYVARKCELHSCEPPRLKRFPTTAELMGAIKRAQDAIWWRRVLRRAAARIVEAGAIKLGMVHRRTGGYASDEAVKRRRAQLSRNAAALSSALYRNEAGQIYTLKELSAASVANPVNRGGELMTRIRGCEEHADAQGHIGLFVTLTTPSAMHPMLSREWQEKGIAGAAADEAGETMAANSYRAVKNPRYDGTTTPREAQQWQVKQWSKARAAMQRKGINAYGFRVAEPHHDGTPHWHLLLWARTEAEAQELQAILYRYWVQNDKRYTNERGAAKNRTNFKRLTAGGAAGYIAKYIAKSIGHHALKEHFDEAETGELMTVELGGEPGHVRVDAWAATWGIRQFQAIGQPSVTVWREVRRVTYDQIEALSWHTDAQARLAWDAAQKIGDKPADWAGFIRAMGGVCLPRLDYRLQPARRGQSFCGYTRYGERQRAGKLVGVRTCSGKWLISRRLMWQPLHGHDPEVAQAKARVDRGETPQDEAVRAAKAAPWTGFNNCTARLTEGRPNELWAETERRAKAEAHAQKWAVIARYLAHKHAERLRIFNATPDELAQAAPPHGPMGRDHAEKLLDRLGWDLTQALKHMEHDGWTRGGVLTYEAACA